MNSPIKTPTSQPVPSVDINSSLKYDENVELDELSQLEKRNILILRLGSFFAVGVIILVAYLFFRFLTEFVLN